MEEDRIVHLDKAKQVAAAAARRFKENKSVLTAYCNVGLEIARLTGARETFDEALTLLKDAEEMTGDVDISRRVARLEGKMNSVSSGVEFSAAELDEE